MLPHIVLAAHRPRRIFAASTALFCSSALDCVVGSSRAAPIVSTVDVPYSLAPFVTDPHGARGAEVRRLGLLLTASEPNVLQFSVSIWVLIGQPSAAPFPSLFVPANAL
jgi:hypothetical protein